jgi:hypothetical protein
VSKKITGEVQPNGSVPWIYTDHGRTWVGVDYVERGVCQYEVAKDDQGVRIGEKYDHIWIPNSVIPFLIRALKKK